MRKLLIDTDTGSDDVWAIIEALRANEIAEVVAITTVCGNLPLDLCTKNAMIAEDAAGGACPPVFKGAETPLKNADASFYADYVHGSDGLSDMDLPMPERALGQGSAVDAILSFASAFPGELEIVTCGPLTNLATALQKDPSFAGKVKKAWLLGGTGGSFGNMTKAAEYNVYIDPEAAQIVLDSELNAVWVTWDAFRNGGEITFAEAETMADSNSPAAVFCARCTKQLRSYYKQRYGKDSFGVIDSVVMTAALFPEIMSETFRAECRIELAHGEQRGHFYMDKASRHPNAEVCVTVDSSLYKKHLFRLLGVNV